MFAFVIIHNRECCATGICNLLEPRDLGQVTLKHPTNIRVKISFQSKFINTIVDKLKVETNMPYHPVQVSYLEFVVTAQNSMG